MDNYISLQIYYFQDQIKCSQFAYNYAISCQKKLIVKGAKIQEFRIFKKILNKNTDFNWNSAYKFLETSIFEINSSENKADFPESFPECPIKVLTKIYLH